MARGSTELDGVIDRLALAAGWDRDKAAGILGQYGESLIAQAETAAQKKLGTLADKLKGATPRPRARRAKPAATE